MATLVGAAAGVLGGLLFAPKSGKETREEIALLGERLVKQFKLSTLETEKRVRDVFGNAGKKAKNNYKKIRKEVVARVVEVKKAGESIDKERYTKIVEDVVDSFKEDFSASKTGAQKLANYLKKDWDKIRSAVVSPEPTKKK